MELFAATSFGRIATWRTSMTDAFSAPRMRTPRGPSRSLWSLHRIVSTSDVLVSPTGTPESKSFSPDVLPIAGMSTLLPTETGVGLTGWS